MRQAECNGVAEFTLPNIAPGPYVLRVYANGRLSIPQKLKLSVGQQLSLNIPAP
jgi:hypothetical protein